MKNVTRTIAVQPVRVLFIINVIVTGKLPIRSLLIESKASGILFVCPQSRRKTADALLLDVLWCHYRSGLSSPTDRLDTAYAASALEGCAVSAQLSCVASRIFRYFHALLKKKRPPRRVTKRAERGQWPRFTPPEQPPFCDQRGVRYQAASARHPPARRRAG